MPRFDSGYTPEQINAIVDELLDQATRDEWGDEAGMFVAIALGLLEGDVIETSGAGTVILPETREQLDARLAAVRARIAAGAPLLEAMRDAG